MNEHELLRRIDRAMDATVLDVPPPLHQLLQDGRLAKRRRSRRTLLTTASALLLAIGAVALTARLTSQPPRTTVSDTSNSETSPPQVRVDPNTRCPPVPAGRQLKDTSGLPVGPAVTYVALNESGTVAAWLEPGRSRSPLPWLVVYDLQLKQEIASEDLGIGEGSRAKSVRIAKSTVYYRSSADANVWLKYQWEKDDFPTVYTTCRD